MTSVLNVDTIAAKNGTDPVTLTKQEALKVHKYAMTKKLVHEPILKSKPYR